MMLNEVNKKNQEFETLEKDIGKHTRYILPRMQEARARFIREHGIPCVEEFEVVGVQRDASGKACYILKCLAFNDTKGRVVDPDLVITFRRDEY
jgi:hypothetical protein